MRIYSLIMLGAAALGCNVATGTVNVTLIDGNHTLAQAARISAHMVVRGDSVSSSRNEDGSWEIDLSFEAEQSLDALLVRTFDDNDRELSHGQSAPFPLSAATLDVTIFLATPASFSDVLIPWSTSRDEVGVQAFSWGAVLVGGKNADDEPSDVVEVYDGYAHKLSTIAALPAARANPTVFSTGGDQITIFGGEDASGKPSADAWQLLSDGEQTGYFMLDTDPSMARVGETAVSIEDGFSFVGGQVPAIYADSLLGFFEPEKNQPMPSPVGISFAGSGPMIISVGSEIPTTGARIFTLDGFVDIAAPASFALLHEHAMVTIPGGDVFIVGGAGEDALPSGAIWRFDAATLTFSEIGQLARPRRQSTVGITEDFVIIAGGIGEGGEILNDAELFARSDFRFVKSIALQRARLGGSFGFLPTGQLLLASGRNTEGSQLPMEIFTP